MEKGILTTSNLKFLDIEYHDISIPENKVTFIVGASGTGKSSLLKLFNQTRSQDSGSIFYNNQNIDKIDT